MAKKKTKKSTQPTGALLDVATNRITTWIGSTTSIVVHTLFFAISFALVLFGISFDTVLLILTTVVSLEAIYLAIFIQRSVNQQGAVIEGEFDQLEEAISEDIDETERALRKEIDETEKNLSDDIDETEIALKKDLDETEKNISDDIDETEAEIAKDIDETPEAIEKPLDEFMTELRKVIREEIQKALKDK